MRLWGHFAGVGTAPSQGGTEILRLICVTKVIDVDVEVEVDEIGLHSKTGLSADGELNLD
jgi:hypothetical protein